MPLSLSALLADPTIDHTGPPITVEYENLWSKDAADRKKKLKALFEGDVEFIRKELAPVVAEWEWEQGNTYYHPDWPIRSEDAGLEGAKVVPIKLNLDESKIFAGLDGFACMEALIKNKFVAKISRPLPERVILMDLHRWKIDGVNDLLKNKLPSHYLMWQSKHGAPSGPAEGLFARIPKPLEGLSRPTSCDHCRIHDPDAVRMPVNYFDDRPGVNTVCEKRAVDLVATPFSLCRFHWWYAHSGQLLRRSHVHVLEMLLSEEVFERWGIMHMNEFLKSVERSSEELWERDYVDPERAWGLVPTGLVDDDPRIENSPRPVTRAEAADPQDAEGSSTPMVPQETVANSYEQPLGLGDQAAVITTAATDQERSDEPTSQVTSSTVPVAQPQMNGTSARRVDGLLYSPPIEPRAMRHKRGRKWKKKGTKPQ
ncbi:hypothetical protein KVR01_008561 [Diaporthe batatas]|uniref:uncharacterized protein n=1 Tax=Diaporthe batatas TaxID=748121 RepID=UPI001D04938F|nr:uncharacterized protein KVR01_008561 [Diaporthe batatas]KAG8161574.1 hypothetical protein KVR01_008561 [Diaporthe batatas]